MRHFVKEIKNGIPKQNCIVNGIMNNFVNDWGIIIAISIDRKETLCLFFINVIINGGNNPINIEVIVNIGM